MATITARKHPALAYYIVTAETEFKDLPEWKAKSKEAQMGIVLKTIAEMAEAGHPLGIAARDEWLSIYREVKGE